MVKILECEHHPGEELVIRLRPPLKSLSPEVKDHFMKAQKELLLSIRSVLDALIEIIETTEPKPPAAKRTKVDVK
jgi:hypothetical protein